MSTGFLHALFHPLVSLELFSRPNGDATSSVDVSYILTAFMAIGIYLVFKRYQNARNRPVLFEWPAPSAADPGFSSVTITNPSLESHLSNPNLAPSMPFAGRKYITCYDPSTSLFLATLPADSAFEIGEKIGLAGRAQLSWRSSTFTERKRFVRSLMRWLVDNREVCARVTCRDTGKTLVDAALGEILTTCSKMEWILAHGEQVLRPEKRHSNLTLSYKTSKVYHEPLGVVAAIVSWNYPLHNAISPLLAALFSGNAIVIKCSENVVWSTTWFIGAVKECLRACGHDPNLVQLVACYPEEAEAVTTSAFIKHITFIGSETVGRKVAQAATVHLTPVNLELGGKDPAVLLPGVNINQYASMWMRGVFQNAGQNCIGIERFIVHSSQHDELVRTLTERTKRLRFGSVMSPSAEGYIAPVDCGAMISRDRFSELERLINNAVEEGASLETGGSRWKHVYLEEGAYFSGTVLGNVENGMEIAQTELFAPVALVLKYDTIQEAIDIANGTRFGLGASVFGPDQNLCLKVARRLDCGMVAVNDFAIFYLNQDLPFGGTKASGYGRFGGPEGLRSLTAPKAIVVDKWPWLMQTSIPAILDYPVRSLNQSWDFISGLIGVLYADRWSEKFSSLKRLIRASWY
ncbi:meiotic sister-chromatid recombination aldehyde dehydrogenase [Sistotremastrum niveocremeum HHB9708]|uniref:Meiotic sister-chromatid recombination aldehyde dehydrogenase n=1 Tax=Sistotremastrum niveocremeum HHB9708 TaxID=1314777 RepID=A0A164ULD4_9AGAM|nr:meiotic sister-chromatid recombination aldehyde dehydrogenase [Sistotremastrum niveocremeum HHB9708]